MYTPSWTSGRPTPRRPGGRCSAVGFVTPPHHAAAGGHPEAEDGRGGPGRALGGEMSDQVAGCLVPRPTRERSEAAASCAPTSRVHRAAPDAQALGGPAAVVPPNLSRLPCLAPDVRAVGGRHRARRPSRVPRAAPDATRESARRPPYGRAELKPRVSARTTTIPWLPAARDRNPHRLPSAALGESAAASLCLYQTDNCRIYFSHTERAACRARKS